MKEMNTESMARIGKKSVGLVVAGTHSGSGKTTVSLGLMAALKKRGLSVAPFKVGPDFIDPGHHRAVTGNPSRNLDGWMLSESENKKIFNRGMAGADIAVVEGVMGMYDGYDGRSEAGSTAQMAKWLGLPVLLVVNAKSMARSAGALVYGFTRFDPECSFCGVLFNRVGSPRHLEYLRQGLEGFSAPPIMGGIPRNADIEIPERHLGLFTSEDHGLSDEHVSGLADFIEEHVDIDALLKNLPAVAVSDDHDLRGTSVETRQSTEKTVRIGVARDNAFCFYYPDNIEVLEESGADIVYFSPVEDPALPDDLDGVYLGGGYPELHAEKLAQNEGVRNALRKYCENGMPVYAECGGFMYLCERLIGKDGASFDMAGCFPFATRMQDKLRSLGYREISFAKDTPVGRKAMVARGHEFHYSRLEECDNGSENVAKDGSVEIQDVYEATDRSGAQRSCPGYLVNRCLGSYVHLHFKSCPEIGKNFVSACLAYQKER